MGGGKSGGRRGGEREGLTRIAVVTATLAALAVGAPAAGADTTWTKVSTDYNANIVVPSLGLTGTTAVVAWTQETSPSTTRSRRGQLHDLADAGRDRRRDQPRSLTGWAQIDYTHALFPAPGGGLQLIFNGIHSTTTGDPLNAMATTLRNADGSWARAVRGLGLELRARRPACSRARPRSSPATPRRASRSSTRPSPTRPGRPDQNLQPQLGGCCGYSRRMALDSAGHLWIAWYSNATGATGVYVQQLDPATGAPDRRARAGAQQREQQQQQLRRGPRVRGDLPRRLRQLAGGRPVRHDRLLVARSGRPDHDRQPGRRPGRAPGAC